MIRSNLNRSELASVDYWSTIDNSQNWAQLDREVLCLNREVLLVLQTLLNGW
jgi:hypothetical protein